MPHSSQPHRDDWVHHKTLARISPRSMITTLPHGPGTLRLHTHEPPTPGPHPAILLLHGAGGNVTFWLDQIAPHITSLGIAVFAVHYFDATQTTRATPDLLSPTGTHVPRWLQAIRATVTHIASRPTIDPTRIALVGISLGAFLACALAATEPTRIRAIVEISGGLTPPWESHATQNFPPTLLLHGAADTLVPPTFAHALDQLLTRLRVPHTLDLLPNEGHWFSTNAHAQILTATAAFLHQHLQPAVSHKAP